MDEQGDWGDGEGQGKCGDVECGGKGDRWLEALGQGEDGAGKRAWNVGRQGEDGSWEGGSWEGGIVEGSPWGEGRGGS